MSAIKSLIEGGGECGTTNPVVDLARQLATATNAQQPALPSMATSSDNFGHGSMIGDPLLSNLDQSSFNMSSLLKEMEMQDEFAEQQSNTQGLLQNFNDETNKLITANEDLWSGAFNDSNNLFTSVAEEDSTWANEFVANLGSSSSNQEVEGELGALADFKHDSQFNMQPPMAEEETEPVGNYRFPEADEVFGVEQREFNAMHLEPRAANVEQTLEQASNQSSFLETQFDDVEFWSNLAEDFSIKVCLHFSIHWKSFMSFLFQTNPRHFPRLLSRTCRNSRISCTSRWRS